MHPADLSEGQSTDPVTRHERDVMNFYVATSRDCDSWDLTWVYAGKPIVPRGPDRAFDKDMVFPSSTVVTHADKHWLYYGGSNERHGTDELDPPVFFEPEKFIGVATLRQDGFVYLSAGEEAGTVLTKPFVWEGEVLELNLNTREGELGIKICDAYGNPVDTGPHRSSVRGVDSLRFPLGFPQLRDKTVRIQFTLRNAKLYAFQIR
jgi:hypothetical protein